MTLVFLSSGKKGCGLYLSDMVSAARKSLIDNREAKMDRERLKTTKRTGTVCTSCISETTPVFQEKT
jgi:hypothetical protein